jgi:hypothetical protein
MESETLRDWLPQRGSVGKNIVRLLHSLHHFVHVQPIASAAHSWRYIKYTRQENRSDGDCTAAH